MLPSWKPLCLGFLAILASCAARPDELTMDNGDRLDGRLVRMVDGKLVFLTDYAGELRISRASIRSLATDDPVEVRLKSGELLKGRLATDRDGRWVVEASPERPALALAPGDIEAINPPPPAWRGNAMLAASRQGGMSTVQSVALFGDAVRRGEENRSTVRALFDYEEGGGETFSRRVFAQIKNDYFFAKKSYYYVDSEQFSDRPQGLNFRTLSGVGIGRQFVERRDLAFRLEAGAAYDGESLVGETTLHAASGQLGAAFDWVPGRWVRLGEQVTVWPGLTDNHVLGRNEAYLCVPLEERWEVRLTSILDYDSRPASGRSHADALWLLGLSYRF